MRSVVPARLLPAVLATLVEIGCAPSAGAQPARPAPLAGPITLHVDATDAPRKLLHAKLAIPVRPGPVTLHYPKWIPGEHSPSGPVANLAGLELSAAGKPIAWRRDDTDMYAFHCEVPAGAGTLDVKLDYIASAGEGQFTAGASSTAKLVDINWNQVVLYPRGHASDDLTVAPRLRLPSGWKYGTALPVARESGQDVEFAPVSLTTLVDSPLVAGAHFRSIDLGGAPPHRIALVADSDAALAMPEAQIAGYRQLVAEASALFGAHPYRSYHFLYTLSDHVNHFGLEHHESSDNRVGERTLLDETASKYEASLLPHELVHSWNGKHRRPAGLATRDYHTPMKGELLWIYEGLTEYLGNVLAARSGLLTDVEHREALAMTAAANDELFPGRATRPLADTAVAAQISYVAPPHYHALRRRADFYSEGELLWLEADVIIRRATGGKRSLDDFCRRFFGGAGGAPSVRPYTLDDVLRALAEVAPHDWRGFWQARLHATGPGGPLRGVTGSGYRLAYQDTPSAAWRRMEQVSGSTGLHHSLGMWVRHDGTVGDVVPGRPAARAGIAPGMKILAVDGRRYTADRIREALRAAKGSSRAVGLLVENGDHFATHAVDYHGGERYPHLERDPAAPDLLAAIVAPRVPRAPAPAAP